jgi:serine/threonine protein kinase
MFMHLSLVRTAVVHLTAPHCTVEPGPEVDLWSAACILPELRTSHPVFPGEDSADQVACISEVLGLPDQTWLEQSPRREKYFDAQGTSCVKVHCEARSAQYV